MSTRRLPPLGASLAVILALSLGACTIIPSSSAPADYGARTPPAAQSQSPSLPPAGGTQGWSGQAALPTPPYAPPVPPPPASTNVDRDGITWAALGQSVVVDGPTITPVAVLEDSRCAMNARCVWAGQVRLQVRTGRGETLEVTTGKPVHVADGTLELVAVRPDKVAGGFKRGEIEQAAYRFGLRFRGGY